MKKLVIFCILAIILASFAYAEEVRYGINNQVYRESKKGFVDTNVNQYSSWKSGTISFYNASYYENNRKMLANRVKVYSGSRFMMVNPETQKETSPISQAISTTLASRQSKQIDAKPIGVQRIIGDYNVYYSSEKNKRNKYG